MANASILAMKEQHVAEIKDRLTRAQSVVMFDYRGLTVDEVTALRVEMRKAGVEYIVLKNTMVERACRELNIDESVQQPQLQLQAPQQQQNPLKRRPNLTLSSRASAHRNSTLSRLSVQNSASA